MGDAIDKHGEKARVREDDLFLALRGGIAVERRLHVFEQHAMQLGKPGKKRRADFVGMGIHGRRIDGIGIAEQQRLAQLPACLLYTSRCV